MTIAFWNTSTPIEPDPSPASASSSDVRSSALSSNAGRGRGTKRVIGALLCVLIVPVAAHAQASIAGTVKDPSGAVLPGVTVEASSPVLIEKARSVVTDGTGQYKVVDLRPGIYTVTFSLSGFSTIKREGIELAGTFTATVNMELRVGAVEETITVTGEAPIVDVQGSKQERVLEKEVIDAIPTGRRVFVVTVLIPGMNVSTAGANVSPQDVGGAQLDPHPLMAIHGGRPQDQRLQSNGLWTGILDAQGGYSNWQASMSGVQEVVVNTGGGSAESPTGGVTTNVIHRDGGNSFRGTFFATGTNSSFAESNHTQDLKDRGFLTPNAIKYNYDINPGYGGPLVRDKLWFFSAAQWTSTVNYVGGMFYNANVGKTTLPDAWLYAADLSRPATTRFNIQSYSNRVTLQADAKNKFSFFYDHQQFCRTCPGATVTQSPETLPDGAWWKPLNITTVTWTNPLSSRFLVEAGFLHHYENGTQHEKFNGVTLDDSLIRVTEQSTGVNYHGASYQVIRNRNYVARASVSYVTGAHAVKVGIQTTRGTFDQDFTNNNYQMTFRFNNGIPNQITETATPYTIKSTLRNDLGIFAQDRWTIQRLTLNFGARFEYFSSYFPETHVGPALLAPTREFTFPQTELVSWKDITPRLGAVFDLFGNGKTALKMSVNKYMVGNALVGTFGMAAAPASLMANTVTRTWSDTTLPVGDPRRGNFWPDCDLTNPLANDECAAMSNSNFGKPIVGAAYDPATLSGWGRRAYDWEFTGGVQQEVLPRVAVNASYIRRLYGNFVVTDNLAVTPADYSPFSVTAPADPRLPNGGGYVISGFYDLNPNKFGVPTSNYLTFSDNYGKQIEHWDGVDVGVDARLGRGVRVQVGTSTGRTVTDNCAALPQLPEVSPLGGPYCRQDTGFITQVKGLATYVIPKIDVQASATLQSIPGVPVVANYVAPNAVIAPSLGRNLSGNATNATVGLVALGTEYGGRLNQLDIRVAKTFRFGPRRMTANADVYNAFNSSAVLLENPSFAFFRQPQAVVLGRFVKLSATIDF